MDYLIDPGWFKDTNQVLLLLVGAVAMYALMKGADWLVEGASGMALKAGVPKVIIGATIVSIGTTAPEAAVSVVAAWRGEPGLALGNAVGSIIADSGLIFGLGCLMVVLPADRFVLNRQGWVQFGVGVMLAALCYGTWRIVGDDASLSRPVGLALVAMLVAYMFLSVRWGRQHRKNALNDAENDQAVPTKHVSDALIKLLGLFLVGLAMVIVFSDVMVKSAAELATQWKVPEVVIASTIIALGTSLPELVVGMTSIRRGHPELLVGNVIGADILNVLFVIGASATAAPLCVVDSAASIPRIFLYLQLPTMLLILVLFRLAIFSAMRKGKFTRWHGAPMLAVYIGFLVLNYFLGTH